MYITLCLAKPITLMLASRCPRLLSLHVVKIAPCMYNWMNFTCISTPPSMHIITNTFMQDIQCTINICMLNIYHQFVTVLSRDKFIQWCMEVKGEEVMTWHQAVSTHLVLRFSALISEITAGQLHDVRYVFLSTHEQYDNSGWRGCNKCYHHNKRK